LIQLRARMLLPVTMGSVGRGATSIPLQLGIACFSDHLDQMTLDPRQRLVFRAFSCLTPDPPRTSHHPYRLKAQKRSSSARRHLILTWPLARSNSPPLNSNMRGAGRRIFALNFVTLIMNPQRPPSKVTLPPKRQSNQGLL
jgi:hypothetical protein